MRRMVSYLRGRGHRVFSYMDDFFRAGGTARNNHQATVADTARAEQDIVLFSRGSASTCTRRSATSLVPNRWKSSGSLWTRAVRSIYLQRVRPIRFTCSLAGSSPTQLTDRSCGFCFATSLRLPRRASRGRRCRASWHLLYPPSLRSRGITAGYAVGVHKELINAREQPRVHGRSPAALSRPSRAADDRCTGFLKSARPRCTWTPRVGFAGRVSSLEYSPRSFHHSASLLVWISSMTL
jgi:hypothetical protein